jgi:hypothetical protein
MLGPSISEDSYIMFHIASYTLKHAEKIDLILSVHIKARQNETTENRTK